MSFLLIYESADEAEAKINSAKGGWALCIGSGLLTFGSFYGGSPNPILGFIFIASGILSYVIARKKSSKAAVTLAVLVGFLVIIAALAAWVEGESKGDRLFMASIAAGLMPVLWSTVNAARACIALKAHRSLSGLKPDGGTGHDATYEADHNTEKQLEAFVANPKLPLETREKAKRHLDVLRAKQFTGDSGNVG